MRYEILDLTQKDRWNDILKGSNNYDFYHTWEYNSIVKEGEPFLFLFSERNDFVAFPLIKRKISGSDLFDLTSAYGYLGPICNRNFDASDDQFLENLKQSFIEFMQEELIVSLFSRLHPIITQPIILEKFGGVCFNGKTVAIDLTQPLETQRANYRRDHARAIHILKEKEFYCREVSNSKGVEIFVSIYHENMRRVKALPEYFFDEDYFNKLLQSNHFTSRILLVYLKDKPVAGGFFTFTNDIIQVHLLSTRNKFLYYSPVKLLIDEVSIIGREQNMKYMHLGGGYGGKDDSLFSWKSGFSDLHFNFHTWRYIHSNEIYDNLVADVVNGQPVHDSDYFPLYRKSFA